MYLSEKEKTDLAAGKYPKEGEKVRCSYIKKCNKKCGSKKIHKYNFEFCDYLRPPTCPNKAKCRPLKGKN